ncbi:MAG: divergent polysaccharide deacetylase family protein [Gammaproteobacteria bacterium]|nr:MAG: divergent polysaccharide deacetylase family protein [Gammaproteobacteria bacterium]
MHGVLRTLLLALLLLITMPVAPAHAGRGPLLAIIIDDIGYHQNPDQEVVELPYPLTLAFLPHTPYARPLAEQAHALGHEIMLHLPMQATNGKALGPDGITLDMTEQAFTRTVLDALASVPHARGINNHMGSLITRHPGHMTWLAELMRQKGDLYFIDSRTTRHTVALRIMREQGLPALARDVFLDSAPPHDADWVRHQLRRAEALARKHGHAIAIGHPYAETLAALRSELPALQARGIRLVRVSQLLSSSNGRYPQWQASSSPSPRVVKNSKPSPSSTCCDAPASKSSPQG